jgi:predicted acetyltransferase
MAVTVEEVGPEHREVVRRLLEFNAYELSRFDGADLDGQGAFGYRYFDNYWTEPGRHPLVIRFDGRIAGLALVRPLESGERAFGEFLVLPKYRRLGVGTTAARAVFTMYPGAWVISEIPGNDDAVRFWRQAIPTVFTETTDREGTVQRFTSSR